MIDPVELAKKPIEKLKKENMRVVYVGSVLNLLPSGKYYTPWACSNVTEEETKADEEWWKAFETELEKHDAWIETGEGDPLDVFVVREDADN